MIGMIRPGGPAGREAAMVQPDRVCRPAFVERQRRPPHGAVASAAAHICGSPNSIHSRVAANDAASWGRLAARSIAAPMSWRR